MRFLDPHLLHTLIILSDCQSFTKTANIVGLSQSAVSQQIKKLEKQLGVSLFQRSKRAIQLTKTGEIFYNQAKSLLIQHEQLIESFNPQKLKGRIRFGSPEDFAINYLPNILNQFTTIYPAIQLDVHCDLTLVLLEAFDRGDYDLIVFKECPNANYPGSISLWKEPLVWVFSDNYQFPTEPTEPVRLALSPEPCVYRSRAIEALEAKNIPWEQVYTSPSLAGTLAAVRGGLGVTVIPLNNVPKDLLHSKKYLSKKLPKLKTTEIRLLMKENSNKTVQGFRDYILNTLHLQ